MPLVPRGAGLAGPTRTIALTWLVRLRWLAVAGQLVALVGAVWLLGAQVPLVPAMAVVGVTLVTNLALALTVGRGLPGFVLPGVILLDVLLLTSLLAMSGGAENPFAILYLVHVALAVVTLGVRWAWLVLGVSAIALAALTQFYLPLLEGDLAASVAVAGRWVALVLIGALIVYFTGRLLAASRKRDAEVAELRERAMRSDSLAALTTLAAGAAHELGTPLGTIAVVAKELQRAGGAAEEDASLIRQEVERCRAILDRMRGDIAETAQLATRRAEVKPVLDAVREQAAGRVQIECPANVPPVAVQARALEQALLLLANNGLDASPTGQSVTIRVAEEAQRVSFAVIDRGHGMPADVLRQAENPFFTTKPPGKGMGLGLFLVRLTADRNGGTFVIDSRENEGTTAVLTLPVA